MSDEPTPRGEDTVEATPVVADETGDLGPTPAARAVRRRALLLVLVGLLLFGSGMVTGAGLLAHSLGRRMKRMADNPGQVAAAAMTRQLNLSAAQRVQVDAILEKHRNDFAAVRKLMAENYRSMADEVKAVLTPAQQATFDQMLARMRKVGMMGGPGDHRHGPGGGPRDWRPPGPPPPGAPPGGPPRDGPH
ncbi:MAG: hypothetical protein HZB16_08685 [Armatimonadetes bacterium]|nr:hypothetical protein [Armatimonadota bacterium]